MGETVEIEILTYEKFNEADQVQVFHELEKGMLACGNCLQSRKMSETKTCLISTIINCRQMV